MAPLPMLRVELLGTFRLFVDDRPVPERAWRSRRAAALIKLLALAPGFRLHREQIMETLWPDLHSDGQRNNLNVSATRARAALAAAGAPAGSFLTRQGNLLVLGSPDQVWIDVAEFEKATTVARPEPQPEQLEAAIHLYRGDLLIDDRYEPWAEEPRQRLRALALTTLARLARRYLATGEVDCAIDAYRRLLALEPADEDATVALMRLYAGHGQPGRALAQYDCLLSALMDDLDATPLPATVALASSIRAGVAPAGTASIPDRFAAKGPARAGFDALPRPLDALIGRDLEIAQLRRVLSETRLVTLTGPGGIGKTRLAVAVAGEMRDRYPDGIAFVDLSTIRDPALVGLAISQALGLRASSGQEVETLLQHYLESKEMLLLLDNAEQVTEAAPLLATLLRHAPQLTLLVTSRMRLRLSGEWEYPVPPLQIPEGQLDMADIEADRAPAVSLFLERARRLLPGYSVSDDRVAVIADICRRVDGLPLGIELAAARVKVLSPAAMLRLLEQPLNVLASDTRDRPERHQTMRRLIAWSHDLLSPPEQRLFRRLAIFLGGWHLDDANVVAGGENLGIDLLDGLGSLVDKNLVVQREGGDDIRFQMLETLRDFGREQLVIHGESQLIGERHATWALALAEEAAAYLESSEQALWLQRLDLESGNLRAALSWLREHDDAERGMRLAIALRMHWFIRGNLQEGIPESRAMLELPGSASFPGLRADLLNSLGLMVRDGDHGLATRFCSESRDISRQTGDEKREADALANLAYIALDRGDLNEAYQLATACLELNQRLNNEQGIADITSVLGLVAARRGESEAARSLLERSLAIWESLDDWQGVIWARTRLAAVLMRIGRLGDACSELHTSYRMAGELDFRWGRSWTLDALAQLAVALNRFDLAAMAANLAAEVRAESGLPPALGEQAEIDALWARIDKATGTSPEDARRFASDHRHLDGDSLVQTLCQIVSEREASPLPGDDL